DVAVTVYLADRLAKPILCEGAAGVGKTALGKALAETTGHTLIRLQCYEGLDEAKALYEWNYKKQLLRIQADSGQRDWHKVEQDIFTGLSAPPATARGDPLARARGPADRRGGPGRGGDGGLAPR